MEITLTQAQARTLNEINRVNREIVDRARRLRGQLTEITEQVNTNMAITGFPAHRTQEMAELDILIAQRHDLYMSANYMDGLAEFTQEIAPDEYYLAGQALNLESMRSDD